MKKIRGLKFTLIAFAALGISLFSNSSPLLAKADEPALIDVDHVDWNNVDYSKKWAPNQDANGIPLDGFCILPLYKSNIASATYENDNLLTAGLPGCNAGDHILVNGVPVKDVSGATMRIYPVNGWFLYVPNSSITYSEEYEFCTIEVLEGMSLDGSYQTVATRFEYRGTLGTFGNWQVNPAPIVKVPSEFDSIVWNNRDYSSSAGWAGELNGQMSPIDGYCLLVGFKQEGKTMDETVIGALNTTGRGVIGVGHAADRMIKVNGINIVDVANTKCYIYPEYGLFFYLPEASMTYTDEYPRPVIEIEEGLHFNEVTLPGVRFDFKADIGTPDGWMRQRDPSELNHFPFTGVAEKWNNVSADASHNQSILQFGEYEKDYLKNDRKKDETNQVTKYSDCGLKITINGVQLCNLPDAIMSYAHQYCYLYFYVSISALAPSNGYKVVTLHIEEGTEFWDTALPETYLYLFNGKWVTERPETPLDEDYDDALSFSDTFDQEKATINMNNPQISATKDASLNRFGLFVDYKLVTATSSVNLFAFGTNTQNGFKIALAGKNIALYDATNGSSLLAAATLETFTEDEWFSLFFYTRIVDNRLSAYVAIDDITYIHVDDVVFAKQSNVGNTFTFTIGAGEASFKNAKLGADNKKPILTFNGKSVYGVLAGSPVIDFTNKCSAIDLVDGDVTKLIQFKWPDGALTDSKINKGTWEVQIVASDKSGNEAKLSVTVIAVNKLEVTVTFDGGNAATYRVGDHIAPISDPTKKGDSSISYKFIGWYYNGKLWDFENDFIVCDMNLESKFQETITEYCVSVTVEGLENQKTYNLYFAYNTKVSISMFEREGYTLKAYVDETEVTTFTVEKNMNLKLVYTSKNPQPIKGGCKGEVSTSIALLSILSGAAIILLVVAKKKGGKVHE